MTESVSQSRPKVRRAATRKTRRLRIILAGMTMLGISVALVLFAFQDNLVFYFTPAQLLEKNPGPNQRVRLGGLVAKGSVETVEGGTTTLFTITDLTEDIRVTFTGILPDLFREGQTVVTNGNLSGNGLFVADEVLAKHDETYMPREVADQLKASGKWEESLDYQHESGTAQ